MIAEKLRDEVCAANKMLPAMGLTTLTWEKTPEKAVQKAMVLEEVAMMAWHSAIGKPRLMPIEEYLQQKHFNRKHGKGAYYGQK